MKNRNKILIALLIAAITLFAATVVASDQPYAAAYDTFKEVMKTKPEMANATVTGTFTLIDNGEVVGKFTNTAKINKDNEKMSAEFAFLVGNDIQKNGQVFADNGTNIFVDTQNDLYYQFAKENDKRTTRSSHRGFERTDATKAHAEAMMDLLVGDYKNNFVLSDNADGTQSVTLTLSESEIPAALNLMASAAGIKKENSINSGEKAEREFPAVPFFEGLENTHKLIPIITGDIRIKSIKTSVTFDENKKVQAGTAEVSVEGRDKAGVYHDLVMQGYFQMSDIGTTTADTIDLTNITVETIARPTH